MKSALSLQSRVRIPQEVIFHNLQGEEVILDLNTGVYWGLDQLGTQIWQLLQTNKRLGDLVPALLAEYAVTEERLRRDLLEFIARLADKGLVEVIREQMA
ncbi:MAG: PqqD family protein [Nitrospirae bacterium]|nr:PqqD family protein [Nitrospirota bacterium]